MLACVQGRARIAVTRLPTDVAAGVLPTNVHWALFSTGKEATT